MDLISAVVITYNEEEHIGRCLDSLRQVADEIIVLDSFSTDKTVEIAKSKGAIVKQRKFSGYIQQKNAAIVFCSHDYILSLDADEALDKVLVSAILAEKNNFSAGAYCMSRCTNYCGKYVRYGTWYPDRKIRLFNRHIASWGGDDPHEKIELKKNIQVPRLKGDILHYSFDTIAAHIKKCDKYSSLSAEAMYARGVKSKWIKILLNPLWAFFYAYFMRLGFLDGFYGFVIAMNSAHATFLKYAKLYQLQQNIQVVKNKTNVHAGSNVYSKKMEKDFHHKHQGV
ncbi:MAG: glycosyltransferase family 2 protein [Bacteroidota bacterium]